MTDFATNYAGALFSLAEEANCTKEILEDLSALSEILDGQREYITLLDTPSVSKEEKCALIDSAFGENVNEYTLNFLKLLAERRAVRNFFDCKSEYVKQYNKANNIECAVVITATEMSDETASRLTEKLERMTGKKIMLERKVDKSIIGGMILRMENTQTDASVKTKLDELSKQISVC